MVRPPGTRRRLCLSRNGGALHQTASQRQQHVSHGCTRMHALLIEWQGGHGIGITAQPTRKRQGTLRLETRTKPEHRGSRRGQTLESRRLAEDRLARPRPRAPTSSRHDETSRTVATGPRNGSGNGPPARACARRAVARRDERPGTLVLLPLRLEAGGHERLVSATWSDNRTAVGRAVGRSRPPAPCGRSRCGLNLNTEQ